MFLKTYRIKLYKNYNLIRDFSIWACNFTEAFTYVKPLIEEYNIPSTYVHSTTGSDSYYGQHLYIYKNLYSYAFGYYEDYLTHQINIEETYFEELT